MKIIILVFITLTIQPIFAQGIQPTNAMVQHNDKMRPCLYIEVDPEAKTLKNAWNDYLKDNYDLKLKGIGFLSNKDLMSKKEVVVKEISPNALDFYTEIIESETGSEMRVFASFGYDVYVDEASMPAEYSALLKMMTTFLNTYIPNYYQEIIDDTEDVVEDLSKDQKKLAKSISKDSDKAEKMANKIESLNKDVSENKNELIEVETKLSNRKQKLETYKSKLNSIK